jgi:large subunit ribosomal protein L13
MKKTYSQKTAEVSRVWYEIDATKKPLGRLATVVSKLIIGKHKTSYTPHIDGGDFVVVINASKVVLTGRKEQDKYYRYTGYPGGLRSQQKGEALNQNPVKVVENAVFGMLPKNKLRLGRMKRLKVTEGSEHSHAAQKPQKLEI